MSFSNNALGFLEGVSIIASPCVYPIVPLLLSTSSTGGKYRPLAIMIGFFINFTIFVFTARYLVNFFGIMPNTIKNISLGFLIFFGAVMLSDKLGEKFAAMTSRIANWAARVVNRAENIDRNDWLVGLMVGATIALVWTPCAGPVLASVITQVIRETDNLSAVGVVLSFAVGVTLPFFIISILGRRAMIYFNWLPKNNHVVKKILGGLIILSAMLIATNVYAAENRPAVTFGDGVYDKPLSFTAPDFVGIQQWLNVDKPWAMGDLRGKVVVINFWTYSCINCQHTLPAVVGWHKKYRNRGLVIIGVHSPEFESDKPIASIQAAINRHGITYPVAVDNKLQTWDNFRNGCWPAFYFINKYGRVVRAICGEHDYTATDQYIAKLLAE
ncbi:MAG: cytochrome c biogenesis protein/redoxin [Hydrotalea sp.]|nr:cytochrome c biogenesis protein/redoxin [Hydrotalea sp.]